MYFVGLTTFSLHVPPTPLVTYCLFRRGNKKEANGHSHLFPEGEKSPSRFTCHPQTNFFYYYYYSQIFAQNKGEKDTPRPTVPKYLRSPTY
jgi:hypothetical protein